MNWSSLNKLKHINVSLSGNPQLGRTNGVALGILHKDMITLPSLSYLIICTSMSSVSRLLLSKKVWR